MEFAKGIKITEKKFDDGNAITNITIDVTQIMENPINNDRFINLTIRRGKESGKLYVVNNEYYQKKSETKVEETEQEIVKFDELPF